MITVPSFQDLSKGQFNRYEMALATAKCARIITEQYVKQKEEAERVRQHSLSKETDIKPNYESCINPQYRDEKAVKVAVDKIYKGDFVVYREDD